LTLTFDRESYFRILYFSIQDIPSEWLDQASSFSGTSLKYVGHISVSRSWVKVKGKGQGHSSEKAAMCNSKTTGRKLRDLIGI